jgi:hypothetical protein
MIAPPPAIARQQGLRLRDSHGHPDLKIVATDDGAGLVLAVGRCLT